jgi:hypothetical protein
MNILALDSNTKLNREFTPIPLKERGMVPEDTLQHKLREHTMPASIKIGYHRMGQNYSEPFSYSTMPIRMKESPVVLKHYSSRMGERYVDNL